MELVAESPTQFDKFAGALVKLQNSKRVTVAGGDRLGNPAQLEIYLALNHQLYEIHSSDLVVAKDPSVTPSNEYLVASLLYAVSMKYRLCDSSIYSAAIAHGLHCRDKKKYRDNVASRQVRVLGACLQLLMSGSYFYGPTGTEVGTDDVLAALEEARVVKHPNGQRLLEVCD